MEDDHLPCTPIPVAEAAALRRITNSLRPFPPMATWVPIHPDDLRSSFHIAVLLEIRSLPQLKGQGASRNRQRLEQAVHAFADRVLGHLVDCNMVFARGPVQQSAQTLGRSYPPDGP